MKIGITEEYGYRYWIWDYPGSKEQLIKDWRNHKAPLNFFDPSNGTYDGSMTEVETLPGEGLDAKAHVHVEDDTCLKIDGKYYKPKMKITWSELNPLWFLNGCSAPTTCPYSCGKTFFRKWPVPLLIYNTRIFQRFLINIYNKHVERCEMKKR